MRLQQRFNASVAFEFKPPNKGSEVTTSSTLHKHPKGRTAQKREALFDNGLGRIMTGSFFQRPEPGKLTNDRPFPSSTPFSARDRSLDLPNLRRSMSPNEYIDSFARKAAAKPHNDLSPNLEEALDEIKTGRHKADFRKRLEHNRVIMGYFPNSMRADLNEHAGQRHLYTPETRGRGNEESNLA
jgi:hypothetical protein